MLDSHWYETSGGLFLNGRQLSSRLKVCRGVWAQGWGLRFTWQAPKQPVLFPLGYMREVTIDMWWVFVSLDIVVTNKDGIVVDLVQSLRPFAFWKPKPGICFIEMAAGQVAQHQIRLGDKISRGS